MIETKVSERLGALGHPARLKIMRLLMATGVEGMAAGELARAACLRASATTFHLDRLRLAGLASRRRRGRKIRYSARFEAMRELLDFLSDACCIRADGDGQCGPICAPSASRAGARDDPHAEREAP